MGLRAEMAQRVMTSYLRQRVIEAASRDAYGGVIFNSEGKILLREPKDHFDGYNWTYPKGRADHGESPEEAALRETREETGIEAEIIAPIPGSFAGGTSDNHFFLMRPIKEHGDYHWETENIRWVDPEEAKELIGETTNSIGQKRDLDILDAAVDTHKKVLEHGDQQSIRGEHNDLWHEFLHEVWEDGKKDVPNPDWKPGDSEHHKNVQMVWRLRKDRNFAREVGRKFEEWKQSRKKR